MNNDIRKPKTIADIAAACGVSRWTVSAVLFPSANNKHVGYSEETKQKVLAAVQRLKYRPNRGSRNLLTRKHGAIGVLTAQFFNIPWHSIHAMLSTAKASDQILSFEAFTPGDAALPLFIRENAVDGLVLYEQIPPAIEQAIKTHNIPAVYVNTCRHDYPNTINMDEAGAIAQAVDHLATGGRKAITLIGRTPIAPFEQERIDALQRACERHGLQQMQPLLLPDTSSGLEAGRQALAEFLTRNPACDALIAPHAGFVGMLFHVCQKLGRVIPRDLAVICMQNPEQLCNFDPPVTGLELAERQMGELAVETLNHLIAGGKPVPEMRLAYAFHARASSRCAAPA